MLNLPAGAESHSVQSKTPRPLSCGPFSIALMLLASLWAAQRGAAPPLSVASVDHGLRAESHNEAELVGLWARSLGLAHHILTWEGEKPETRVQERAREARYALLFRHARDIGANFVLTAHHADDQAETILFRLLRGSGIAGLAGMPKMTTLHGLVHFRPLLDHRKETLVALCEAR